MVPARLRTGCCRAAPTLKHEPRCLPQNRFRQGEPEAASTPLRYASGGLPAGLPQIAERSRSEKNFPTSRNRERCPGFDTRDSPQPRFVPDMPHASRHRVETPHLALQRILFQCLTRTQGRHLAAMPLHAGPTFDTYEGIAGRLPQSGPRGSERTESR